MSDDPTTRATQGLIRPDEPGAEAPEEHDRVGRAAPGRPHGGPPQPERQGFDRGVDTEHLGTPGQGARPEHEPPSGGAEEPIR